MIQNKKASKQKIIKISPRLYVNELFNYFFNLKKICNKIELVENITLFQLYYVMIGYMYIFPSHHHKKFHLTSIIKYSYK